MGAFALGSLCEEDGPKSCECDISPRIVVNGSFRHVIDDAADDYCLDKCGHGDWVEIGTDPSSALELTIDISLFIGDVLLRAGDVVDESWMTLERPENFNPVEAVLAPFRRHGHVQKRLDSATKLLAIRAIEKGSNENERILQAARVAMNHGLLDEVGEVVEVVVQRPVRDPCSFENHGDTEALHGDRLQQFNRCVEKCHRRWVRRLAS
jgi:hypothetical protein